METLAQLGPGGLDPFETKLRARLSGSPNLERAAQTFAREIVDSFPQSTVLARVYAALPFELLPPDNRAFAQALATSKGAGKTLAPTTPVLSLLGTYGAKPAWCDRRLSKGHVGIPLIDARFVESIPMVARLLQELGIDLKWYDQAPSASVRRLVGGFNGVFYVEDATRTKDARGRFVIPDQEFVAENGVQTVFGMGGHYLDGTLVAAIVFARESVKRAQAEQFATLISLFKMCTAPLVRAGRAFDPPPTGA